MPRRARRQMAGRLPLRPGASLHHLTHRLGGSGTGADRPASGGAQVVPLCAAGLGVGIGVGIQLVESARIRDPQVLVLAQRDVYIFESLVQLPG